MTIEERRMLSEKSKQLQKISRTKRPERHIFFRVRAKCKKNKIPFNLEIEDIIIPALCPLLEIPLTIHDNGSSFDTPSVDRIDPNKGYTKGNVWIISNKANVMKQDVSIEMLKKFAKNILDKL